MFVQIVLEKEYCVFLNDFFSLVLVCKDFEPRYKKARTRGFFSTVRC